MILDSNFNNKYNLRYILINKLGFFINRYQLPFIKKLIIFFHMRKLEDFDHVQMYNYYYLIKFFFGRIAFFSKFRKFFILGTWYNNLSVQLIVNDKNQIHVILSLFFNNIFSLADKSLAISSWNKKYKNVFFFVLKDLNIYSEMKTNLGLFSLKKPLNINLVFKGYESVHNSIYLNVFKYI